MSDKRVVVAVAEAMAMAEKEAGKSLLAKSEMVQRSGDQTAALVLAGMADAAMTRAEAFRDVAAALSEDPRR